MVSGGALGQPKDDRGAWNSRLGFILAAVGSAVGLGNIWRFPFTTAEGGGGAFVAIYLVILFLVGVPVMFAELALGRRGKLSPVGTFRKLSNGNPFWTGVGWLFVFTSLFIISWYSVIGGWVIRYMFGSMSGAYFADPSGYFNNLQDGPMTLALHAVMMIIVTAVLAVGVTKGIERTALIMMPILAFLVLGISIWVAFLDGAGAGYSFYLQPDFSEVNSDIITAAVGQAFFSLSLGQGAILTYASYLDDKESLTENGSIISLADTGVALAGGFMVFPALAAFGLLAANESGGAGALFVGLATAFSQIGIGGRILGTLFFTALFFAAFTSAISLLEVSISFVRDQWKISRARAAILMGIIAYTGGILAALNRDIFTIESGQGTDIIVILGGLLISIFVGWVMKDVPEELDRGGRLKLGVYGRFMVRYPVPLVLLYLLVDNIIQYANAIRAGEVFLGL